MRLRKLLYLLVLLAIVILAYQNYVKPAVAPASTSQTCDASLWSRVYNPERLQVIQDCTTVSGTIQVIRKEADGDLHILLKLDSQFENLLNQKNIDQQQGDLVLEPVCVNAVTQEDAIGACANFTSNVYLPKVGEHVQVTGPYVLDKQHGWNEVHPVTSITPR